MNRISRTLASLAILGLAGTAAQAAVVVDGYNFDFAYTGDGDVLPTASTPTWTTGGSGAATMSGGVATINTFAAPSDKWFEIVRGGSYNPTTNVGEKGYVQFRMKVNSEADGVRFGSGIYLAAQAGSIGLFMGEFNGNTGLFDNAHNFIAPVDVYQWHTYRVELDANAPSYRVWVDDFTYANQVANGTGYGNGASTYFGDGSGDIQGSSDWDYVAWNNSGLPTAVPEPAALSLVGLGALLAIRRRA